LRQTVIRMVYLTTGIICVILGLIGVALPLLPTTPFILVAAFCFSRSSERLHQYLLNHKIMGGVIREWEEHGVIPFKVKLLSTTMMLVMVTYPLLFKEFHLGLKAAMTITIIIALVYVWSRPSLPKAKSEKI